MATNGTEIDTYSVIENDDFDEGIDAVAVEGDLYDNTSGSLLQSEDDEEEDEAEVDLSASVNAPHQYELDTYTAVCVDDGEGDCDEEDGPDFSLVIDTDYPEVSSINPSSITVGTSGTITVNGQNFIDYFGDAPTPFINNSGVTLSLGSISDTQAKVSYSVTTGAATGDFGLNLKGLFGNGEPATLAVGDPTPVVTSISPSVWYAGNSYTVTITGTNFGTSPTSSISAAPGVTYGQTGGNDTTITASVTVAPNAPTTNPITVSVTSQGFGGGSGFFSGTGGSASASNTAQSVENIPSPTINLLNGTPNSPYAGGPVLLSVTPPPGFTLASQTWSFGKTNDVVAGWNASAASGCYVSVTGTGTGACPGQSLNLTQTQLGNFYFIIPAVAETVTVNAVYNLAGGSTTAAPAKTQTFNVQGPTGNLLPTAYDLNNDGATVLGNANGNPASLKMSNAPSDPNVNFNPVVGVRFDDLAVLPRGSFNWIQILNTVNYLQIAPAGFTGPSNAAAQLDGVYPYPQGSVNTTNDSPGRPDLLAGLGVAAISFDATMYALWDAAIPRTGQANCSPATTNTNYVSTASTCASIPIPLGAVEWKWTPCAINTDPPPPAGTGPIWVLKCGPGSVSPGTASGYPTWTSCHKSANGSC